MCLPEHFFQTNTPPKFPMAVASMTPSLTLYQTGYSNLHRLNPLTKLTAVICLLLLAFWGPGRWLAWGLTASLLLLAASSHLTRALLHHLRWIVLPLALSLLLVHGLFNPAERMPLWPAGPLLISRTGLIFALLMTGRLLAAAAASLLFVFTTAPGDLTLALQQRGMPHAGAYLIGASLQIVPQMRARAATILLAQQARGLETTGSLLARSRALLPLLLPLILTALADAEERALTLETRGFTAPTPKTSLRTLADPAAERWTRWLLVTGTLLAISSRWWL